MKIRCNMWGRLPWCYANFGITSWVPMMLCQLISIVMEWYTVICSHSGSCSCSRLCKWLQEWLSEQLQAQIQLLLPCCWHDILPSDVGSWACSHLHKYKQLQERLQEQLQAQLQVAVYDCSNFHDVAMIFYHPMLVVGLVVISMNVICSCSCSCSCSHACSCLYLCKQLQEWLQVQLQVAVYHSITVLVCKRLQAQLQPQLQAQLQSQYWHQMRKPMMLCRHWYNITGGFSTCHTGLNGSTSDWSFRNNSTSEFGTYALHVSLIFTAVLPSIAWLND